MDVTGEDRGRLARVAAWFEATPAELTGLLVLVAGALLASVALWAAAAQRPEAPTPDGSAAGTPRPGAGDVGDPLDGSVTDDQGGGHGAAAPPPSDGGAPADAGAPSTPSPDVTVHVTGGVADPGVVTLPGGSRVADAIVAAGGATGDADPERVNLARQLQDGEHVHLPRVGEDPPAVVDGPDGGGVTADGLVDLNRADASELETLPGIGPAKASNIVSHREEHGPFQVPGDLREVSGIGEKTFQGLADLVTVGP